MGLAILSLLRCTKFAIPVRFEGAALRRELVSLALSRKVGSTWRSGHCHAMWGVKGHGARCERLGNELLEKILESLLATSTLEVRDMRTGRKFWNIRKRDEGVEALFRRMRE